MAIAGWFTKYLSRQGGGGKSVYQNLATKIGPFTSVTQRIKRQMMANVPGSLADYELDNLIPLELGGCSDCFENLWLEPYLPIPGAHQKNEVENYLHREVCNGVMPLREAQQRIAADWYQVYLGIPAHAIVQRRHN